MALLIRTDFSDDAAWERVAEAASAPVDGGFGVEFQADLTPISDPVFRNVSVDQIMKQMPRQPYDRVIFVADTVTVTDPESPIIAVDLADEPGARFRVVPNQMWAVENNMTLGNMWFSEYANAVDTDGVFRGFSRPGDG